MGIVSQGLSLGNWASRTLACEEVLRSFPSVHGGFAQSAWGNASEVVCIEHVQ